MKQKLAVVAIIIMVVAIPAGCSLERQLDLSDPAIYTGKLVSVVYQNSRHPGYMLSFEDGKTVLVNQTVGVATLYEEGFDLGEFYTLSLTRNGQSYVQRTDVLEKRRAAVAGAD